MRGLRKGSRKRSRKGSRKRSRKRLRKRSRKRSRRRSRRRSATANRALGVAAAIAAISSAAVAFRNAKELKRQKEEINMHSERFETLDEQINEFLQGFRTQIINYANQHKDRSDLEFSAIMHFLRSKYGDFDSVYETYLKDAEMV